MKIKLPELPLVPCFTKINDGETAHAWAYPSDEMAKVLQDYARQAIREFVEGLEVAARMSATQDRAITVSELAWIPNAGGGWNDGRRDRVKDMYPIPLIIKPELDDADE